MAWLVLSRLTSPPASGSNYECGYGEKHGEALLTPQPCTLYSPPIKGLALHDG